MEQNNKIWLWILAVVVVIGGIYLALRGRNSNPDTLEAPQAQGQVDNALSISAQEPTNLGAIIDSVSLREPGFIIIHENQNGAPGKIIAQSQLLTAGARQDVNIIASLTPGNTYWAMLHKDDGNGTFDAQYDLPAQNAAGQIINVSFEILSSISGGAKG